MGEVEIPECFGKDYGKADDVLGCPFCPLWERCQRLSNNGTLRRIEVPHTHPAYCFECGVHLEYGNCPACGTPAFPEHSKGGAE
jgi:hypothetical protein